MMDQQSIPDTERKIAFYYGVRLLVTHPSMSVGEVTAAFGMKPDHFWNAGERKFTNNMMWGHTSWTEGTRLFFDEVHEVLEWLHDEQVFVSHLLATGGELQVIVQLPGNINVGDTLKFETMSLAVKLGVAIGIEVFPNLAKPLADD
jgi:hypothetical protein